MKTFYNSTYSLVLKTSYENKATFQHLPLACDKASPG